MEQKILNIVDPSKASMKYIEEYDAEWKANFKWLEEIFEEMKLTLSKPKQLLPSAPKNRKLKNSSSVPKNDDCSPSGTDLPELKCSKENVCNSISTIRTSKRIASRVENRQAEIECVFPISKVKQKSKIVEKHENSDKSNRSMIILEKCECEDLNPEENTISDNITDPKNSIFIEKEESISRINSVCSESKQSFEKIISLQENKELSIESNINSSIEINVTPTILTSVSTGKELNSESSLSNGISSTPTICSLSSGKELLMKSNNNIKMSSEINSTPTISASISRGKLCDSHTGYISKVSSGSLKKTPQPGLSCVSQKSLIARVKHLKHQMTPKIKDTYSEDDIKRRQKREEEVLQKKYYLLNMKIEEQKRKREERMRRAIETRQKLEHEKEVKHNLELTKEERAAKKEVEYKLKQKEIIRKRQLMRKLKQAEVEKRRKQEEELRLQKLQTPSKPKPTPKFEPVNYISKDIEVNNEEKLCKERESIALNATYNKLEKEKKNSDSNHENTTVKAPAIDSLNNFDDYGIDDLKSEDDTDDESAPRKTIPAWAQGVQLHNALLQQYYNPPDLLLLFGEIELPDLNEIFSIKTKHLKKRTSSAEWF